MLKSNEQCFMVAVWQPSACNSLMFIPVKSRSNADLHSFLTPISSTRLSSCRIEGVCIRGCQLTAAVETYFVKKWTQLSHFPVTNFTIITDASWRAKQVFFHAANAAIGSDEARQKPKCKPTCQRQLGKKKNKLFLVSKEHTISTVRHE